MSTRKLVALRGQIEALIAERDAIADAAMDRTEAATHIDAVFKEVETHPILGPSPAGLRNGSFNGTELEKMLRRPGMLIALLREPLKAYLLGVFDAEAGETTGLPAGKRHARLAELDGQIYQLEQEEERQIEQLEEQGVDVIRRPDADPSAALGLGVPSEAA